ncbi:MAG: phosphonopyruvate decarboxylase [Aminipila sp.]
MNIKTFVAKIEGMGIDFYTGVPDSQLKALCDYLYLKYGANSNKHIVAANEGAAVGLAAGCYLSTGKPALVYLQNSGIGNAINPIASLLNEKVYDIPCLFVIGWRGEPGVKDEPQHIYQGEITLPLLEVMGINYFTISSDTTDEEYSQYIVEIDSLLKEKKSVAFVVKKDSLVLADKVKYSNEFSITREEAIRQIVTKTSSDHVFVSTTGKASRELFEIREELSQSHENDFLTVGSMGHASMIALGIAINKPERTIWCIDGDGAMVMHMGSALVESKCQCENLIHVVINNGAHESVGGMPVATGATDFCKIAYALGFSHCFSADSIETLDKILDEIMRLKGTRFLEIKTSIFSRKDLGRPTSSPKENKSIFMERL